VTLLKVIAKIRVTSKEKGEKAALLEFLYRHPINTSRHLAEASQGGKGRPGFGTNVGKDEIRSTETDCNPGEGRSPAFTLCAKERRNRGAILRKCGAQRNPDSRWKRGPCWLLARDGRNRESGQHEGVGSNGKSRVIKELTAPAGENRLTRTRGGRKKAVVG